MGTKLFKYFGFYITKIPGKYTTCSSIIHRLYVKDINKSQSLSTGFGFTLESYISDIKQNKRSIPVISNTEREKKLKPSLNFIFRQKDEQKLFTFLNQNVSAIKEVNLRNRQSV